VHCLHHAEGYRLTGENYWQHDSIPGVEVSGGPAGEPGGVAHTAVATYRHEALATVLQVRDCRLRVLLWLRARDPFAGSWALPSGPLEPEETLGASVARHLATKVDVRDIAHLEQLETRSDPGRDPHERTVATAYLGLVPTGADPALPAHAAWHDVEVLPQLAFDHESVTGSAVERLRSKLSYTNLGFALAPAEFTMSQLREVYAAALGHDVGATNLQRILTRRGQLEPTGRLAAPTRKGGRPATVFRFVSRRLEITDQFAVLRPVSATPPAGGTRAVRHAGVPGATPTPSRRPG
jgi:8-oxo-dGTP diphosphatase